MATGLHHRPVMCQTSVRSEGSTKCSIHRNKEFVFVCSDCNELICTTCCVSGHRNHTLEEITDVNSRQRGKLLDFVNDTEKNKLPELQKELKSIEEKVAETEHDLGTVLPGQMQQRGKMCKTGIDRYISQLESSCQEKKNENIELLLIYKNEIQKRYEHLVLMTKECKQILQSGTSVLVFDKIKDVECLKREPYTMPVVCTPEYKSGTDIPQYMEQAIGTLETCTPKYKPGTDNSQQRKQAVGTICSCLGVVTRTWKKLSSFLKVFVICLLVLLLLFIVNAAYVLTRDYVGMNCTKISTLVPTPDGGVWFLDKKSNTTLLLHDGNTENLQHYSNILDLSLSTKTGTLWLSPKNAGIVEVAPPSSMPRGGFTNLAYCLHVTKKGNLVLGWDHLEIYTKEGIVCHKADDASLRYMVPVQIIECPITGNIAVVRVHMVKPWISDIAVYDETLTVLFYYEMPGPGWNSVVSIAYDSFGNIVIGDSRTQTVYMKSGTGQYIKHLFDIKGELRCIAIQTPCNILWVAVQYDISMNRKVVKIKQRLFDLPNPSNECKQLRLNALKTVYRFIKDRERESYSVQELLF